MYHTTSILNDELSSNGILSLMAQPAGSSSKTLLWLFVHRTIQVWTHSVSHCVSKRFLVPKTCGWVKYFSVSSTIFEFIFDAKMLFLTVILFVTHEDSTCCSVDQMRVFTRFWKQCQVVGGGVEKGEVPGELS